MFLTFLHMCSDFLLFTNATPTDFNPSFCTIVFILKKIRRLFGNITLPNKRLYLSLQFLIVRQYPSNPSFALIRRNLRFEL